MNTATSRIVNVRLITKLYDELIKPVSKTYGLTAMEINIISFLHNNPELNTASDISAYRNFPKSNVSQGVCALSRDGYLRCVPYEDDRRKTHLWLTRKSLPVISDIDECIKKMQDILLRDFTDEEKDAYAAFQRRVVSNVKEYLEND